MQENIIDISKLNKAHVLIALYHYAKPQGIGILHYNAKDMSVDEAEALLKNQTYFDYLQGRVMKVDLSGDELNTTLYNRDNGEDIAQYALRHLEENE